MSPKVFFLKKKAQVVSVTAISAELVTAEVTLEEER